MNLHKETTTMFFLCFSFGHFQTISFENVRIGATAAKRFRTIKYAVMHRILNLPNSQRVSNCFASNWFNQKTRCIFVDVFNDAAPRISFQNKPWNFTADRQIRHRLVRYLCNVCIWFLLAPFKTNSMYTRRTSKFVFNLKI